jgi:hypothetical protein
LIVQDFVVTSELIFDQPDIYICLLLFHFHFSFSVGFKIIGLVCLAGAAKGGGVDLLDGLVVCCAHGFALSFVVYIGSEPPHPVRDDLTGV